jgi:nitroreductase
MPTLHLSPDEVLATTRSVHKRFDLSRPVDPAVIRECLDLAVQAPTGANSQGWHFVVVTDPEPRQALRAIYRRELAMYLERMASGHLLLNDAEYTPEQVASLMKVRDSALYLADHMHEVPVMIVPWIRGHADGLQTVEQAGLWGSVMPAVWSFMLGTHSRGLGTYLNTVQIRILKSREQ